MSINYQIRFVSLASLVSIHLQLGRRRMLLHVANQPHQNPSRPCVTERNDRDVFIVCSDLVT